MRLIIVFILYKLSIFIYIILLKSTKNIYYNL